MPAEKHTIASKTSCQNCNRCILPLVKQRGTAFGRVCVCPVRAPTFERLDIEVHFSVRVNLQNI